MHDRLGGLKRGSVFDSWWWLAVAALLLVGVGFAIWWWRRRADRKVDEAILVARSVAQGLDDEERELMLEIARLGKVTDPADIVPKVRAYNAAIGSFLGRIDHGDRERLTRLLERLGSIRAKLGFDDLGPHRRPPTTRELPVGSNISFRRDRGDRFVTGVLTRSDELSFSVLVGSAEEVGVVPAFAAGDRFEGSFANGGRSRGHFVTDVVGPYDEAGLGVPIAHTDVTHADASARGPSDRVLIARLTLRKGKTIPVRIREIGLTFVRLASALPERARAGTLAFTLELEGGAQRCQARVARRDDDELTLRVLALDEASTAAVLAHRRRPTRALATLRSDDGTVGSVTVVELGEESVRLERPSPKVRRGLLVVNRRGEDEHLELPVERSADDPTVFVVREAEAAADAASA